MLVAVSVQKANSARMGSPGCNCPCTLRAGIPVAHCCMLLLLVVMFCYCYYYGWLISVSLFFLFVFWEHSKYLIVTEPRMTWASATLASAPQLLVFIPGVCHYTSLVLCEGSVPGSIMPAKHSTNRDTKWIIEKGFSFHHKLTPVWMMLTRCCKQKLAPPHPTPPIHS